MALDLQKFILRFIEEAREHLGRLGEGLAQLDAGHSDREGVNALFRSAHTIKGSSRMLRLASITAVAHQVEEVLGSLREGSQTYTPALGQLLYRAVDHLAALVDALAQSGNAASLPPADEALCQALAQAGQPATGPQEEVGQVAAPPVPAAPPQAAPVATPAPAPAPLVGPGAAPAVAPANAPPQLQAAQTVRVRLDKLDGLVKLMGEVVASHARLRQRLADIQALLRELGEAPPPALLVFERQLKDDVQAQEGLMHELHDKTLVMRMLALAIVFEPAARLVRELARSVGKEVECQVSGSEIELDRQLIDQLADPIIHLIRNAVDHGIEPPDVRRAAGKPTQGRVQLSARQDGGWVVIELSDDGAGIALQAVRDKAVKKGLLSADKAAALSDQEAIDLIFLPGFSTSSMITDLSGRGVGMDVVKQTVLDELQGSVSVHTRSGMGTTFSLRLPLSLAMLRVLLVQVQGQAFGFTAQHVAELVRLPRSALLPMAEREAVIVRNEFVPVVALDALLQLPATAGARTPAAPGTAESSMLLVVLQVRHDKIAVCVDSLLDERDMVIQPLPPHMRRLPLVSGMVTTGSNALVSVLHAPALLEQARRQRAAVQPVVVASARAPYRVLVVDDSLNTREIEKDVLQAYGYDVTLAEDGQDGLRKALAQPFDAILTDVEMPYMDGFTLTAQLRQQPQYQGTPIVIITSREKEEDKRRGMQVGADAYIVKGDFDQSNLVETLRTLLG